MLITKIERQKNRKNAYNIYIDGEYSFSISDENLLKLKLKEGLELDENEFNSIILEKKKKDAMDYAFRLLGIRSRSEKELREKLKFKNFSGEIADSAVKRLNELGYINDMQFAKDWAGFQKNRGKGAELIKIELKHKGIDTEIIKEVLKSSEETSQQETDRLRKLAEQKLRRMDKLDPETASRRLISFLSRRGFTIDAISKVLKDLKRKG